MSGQFFLSEAGQVVCCILFLIFIIALITALINDRVNCVLCVIIGAISMFFIHKLCILDFLIAKGETIEKARSKFVLLWTTIFGAIMLLRFFPCLNVHTEKHTYLIMGTLIEESESHAVGIGTFFFIPAILTTSFYFVSNWLVGMGWYYIGYIAMGIFLLFSVTGLIRSFFE